MSRKIDQAGPRDIAVIGVSCRFPGARNADEFWQDLRDGVESISFFSDDELLSSGTDPAELEDPHFVRAGSVLEDIDLFDAAFFGFNPREAEAMDPQQRIFLECAWHCLEDAGYDPAKYDGAIGVYAGCAMSTYTQEIYRNPAFCDLVGPVQVLIGNDKDYLTTHTSYKLNLRGPSISVQTTCSTSLVAAALACESLVNRQCDMALAGGVCIRVPQKAGYYHEPGGIFSPDGHCRVFDAQAGGVVFGNGVGIVLLKRLADAIADGDCIDAVIKGTAINNDGASKDSYTAPSVSGQAKVVRMAQAAAGVGPETIGYVEAHGTATAIGDPVEVAALTRAFEAATDKRGYCAIGSVKSNFGHLDHAAGIAGLIKTILALKHRSIPPTLHLQRPNPEVDFEHSPFFVNTELSKWRTKGHPRRAGVSAFGIGGTNVHVVVEEAPRPRRRKTRREAQLLLMSARSEAALEDLSDDMIDCFRKTPRLNAADVAYTSHVGRREFPYRRALVYTDLDDAARSLETLDPNRVHTGSPVSERRQIAFMFPGQGSQHVGMAAGLYETEPRFRRQMDHCIELLLDEAGIDLRRLIYPPPDGRESAAGELNQTISSQTALFAIEYTLARLWMHWGIEPQAMIGHSIGEYVAACLAGVFSLDDALRLVAERGRLMQEAPRGAMLAVGLAEQELASWLGSDLALAAVNAPALSVVSGAEEAIVALEARLAETDTQFTRLNTSHAFHSPMMQPVLERFEGVVAKVRREPPTIPYVSNVTGTWITPEDATDPGYWSRHLRQTVQFAAGIRELSNDGASLFLEVGPGQQLGSLAARNLEGGGDSLVLSSLPHPLREQPESEVFFGTLARLWISGADVDWTRFHADERRCRVHLPPYPFEGTRYWVDTVDEEQADPSMVRNPDIGDWFYVPTWNYSPATDTQDRSAGDAQSRWLVFTDECGVGAELVRLLVEAGADVTVVRADRQFSRIDAGTFGLDPSQESHYGALFKELRLAGRMPDRILHLWGIRHRRNTSVTGRNFDRAQDLGFYSVLYVTRSLGGSSSDVRITVVTSETHQVTGKEKLDPAKATVLGACKAVSQEFPNLRYRSVDVALPRPGRPVAGTMTNQLFAEVMADSPDPVVAFREGQRWVQGVDPVHLGEAEEPSPLLRDGGIYLITGGLGGIGLTIAEEIASTVWSGLVLIGRSPFPPRRQWKKWLSTHPTSDATSTKIRRLQAIEAGGSEVMVLRADVGNAAQMQKAFKAAEDRFGVVNGVVHAAGTVAEDAFFSIEEANRRLCELHFAPKARGLMVLDAILRRRDIDFCLLTSSLSSFVAGLGYIAYSAANIFMDAFAVGRYQETGVPWISVNWDNWSSDENADPEHADPLMIYPEEGVETVRRVLTSGWPPQIAVSVSDLQARIDRWVKLDYSTDLRMQKQRQSHARPDLAKPYVPPRDKIEQVIADTWIESLGLELVSVHDNFFSDLNGTSLLATQLVARIRSRLGVELPLRHFFEGPTVADLATVARSMLEDGGAGVSEESAA